MSEEGQNSLLKDPIPELLRSYHDNCSTNPILQTKLKASVLRLGLYAHDEKGEDLVLTIVVKLEVGEAQL